jgi:hypothetical protein
MTTEPRFWLELVDGWKISPPLDVRLMFDPGCGPVTFNPRAFVLLMLDDGVNPVGSVCALSKSIVAQGPQALCGRLTLTPDQRAALEAMPAEDWLSVEDIERREAELMRGNEHG